MPISYRRGVVSAWVRRERAVVAQVALKVLRADFARDADFVARFRQEARLVAALNDPHVTVIHDFDQADDGSPFIVMEWLQGRVLSEVIQRQGVLGLPRAVRLATQIAEGLEAAHRAGVIHRTLNRRTSWSSPLPTTSS